jgi:chloride channel protein, CIC family
MLGGLVGLGAHSIFPDALPSAYALVGMGGVLTAVVRAPITAVLLIFEITNDYRIILPIMLCVAVSNVVAGALHRESIYTERLVRSGVRLRRGEPAALMENIRVGEAMSDHFISVQWHQSLRSVLATMTDEGHHSALILDGEALAGIATVRDIMRALDRGVEPGCPVGEIAETELVVAHPEQSLHEALLLFAAREVRQVPVVDAGGIVGLLRRSDLILSYSSAVGRNATIPAGNAQRARD